MEDRGGHHLPSTRPCKAGSETADFRRHVVEVAGLVADLEDITGND